MIGLAILLSFVFLHTTKATLHVNLCCAKASGNCKTACEEITSNLMQNEDNFSKNDLSMRLLDYCPSQNIPLWRCINQTDVQDENEIKWAGRVCCHLAETEPCHQACKHADRIEDISGKCRMSDEITLYECVEKKQKGEECCKAARNSHCHNLCRKSLVSRRVTRQHMATACAGGVNDCMNSLNSQTTFVISQKLGHCCDMSENVNCRERCKLLVSSRSSDTSIVEDMHINNCGIVSFNPNDPVTDGLWKCIFNDPEMQGVGGGPAIGGGNFQGGLNTGMGMLNPGGFVPEYGRPNRRPVLRFTTSRPSNDIQDVGLDVTKTYCCNKATTPGCRNLCFNSFSSDWRSQYPEFNKKCLSAPEQRALNHCLEDVNESCELGCEGLSFCTTFNHRPTQLFRSCNRLNDEAAEKEVTRWTLTGLIEIPYLHRDFQLFIKNISQCNPQIWKIIACTLMIKPCTPKTHSNRICRSNCYEVLNPCLDWQKMHGHTTAGEICNILSPDDDSETCIKLEDFLDEKKPLKVVLHKNQRGKPITTSRYDMSMKISPCKNSTCQPFTEVCNVNRACADKNCADYSCDIGCRLGVISSHTVPVGTYTRILTNAQNSDKICTKICQCSPQGIFNNCHPPYCTNLDFCKKDDRMIEHGTVLNGTCPKCYCNAGELICNKHQCNTNKGVTEVNKFTGLPCNCTLHYVPVCGWNGVTFPNECLAKCNGLHEGLYQTGKCSEIDACKQENPCSHNEECLWTPQVCLFSRHSSGTQCPQYTCVRKEDRCPTPQLGVPTPVCSKAEEEYRSLCELVKANDNYGYKGRCLGDCDEDFEVCGMDGRTYKSECTAHAHKVMKDYSGECRAFGIGSLKPRCASISCPKLPRKSCTGYVPPGACCPYCGAALRVLFSQREYDKIMQSLGSRAVQVFTVESIISALERHVQVKNCRLFGHLSIESDLIIMVVPVKEKSAISEIQLCFQEAEKLKVMINLRNPRFLSESTLSPLLYARSVHYQVSSGSLLSFFPLMTLFPLLTYYFR